MDAYYLVRASVLHLLRGFRVFFVAFREELCMMEGSREEGVHFPDAAPDYVAHISEDGNGSNL